MSFFIKKKKNTRIIKWSINYVPVYSDQSTEMDPGPKGPKPNSQVFWAIKIKTQKTQVSGRKFK